MRLILGFAFFVVLVPATVAWCFSKELNPISDRERFLQDWASVGGITTVLLSSPIIARASSIADSSISTRLSSSDSSSYRPGVKVSDVFYPQWFQGDWKSCSVFDTIECPLGLEVIGGKTVFQAAQKELNSELCYTSRFIAEGDTIISDRLFNVEQIAVASMGNNSIFPLAQKPNTKLTEQLQLIVSPEKANGAKFEIALLTTDREVNQSGEDRFQAMERCTQIIRSIIPPDPSGLAPPPSPALRKEIETITSYERVSSNMIIGKQRTATFLSALDPRYKLAFAREPRVASDAVDIRQYSVTYRKL